jgi:hypothetical protein
MPRSTVIRSQIATYDKIINDNRTTPDTELAIFKLAICQLVDAVFSGGGGGGSTTAQIVSDGIDQSADINTIITRLTTIATNTSTGASNVVSSYLPSVPAAIDTGVVAIAANASRKHAIIVNRSTTETVDLFLGALGLFGAGLPLLPQQAYEINSTNLYTGIVRAITASGITANLSVLEGM